MRRHYYFTVKSHLCQVKVALNEGMSVIDVRELKKFLNMLKKTAFSIYKRKALW